MTRANPGLTNAYVRPSLELYKDDRGEVRHGVNITMTPDDWEAFRQGYKCAHCQTVQDEPFPEECKAVFRGSPEHGIPDERCGYRMRDWQPGWLQRQFAGEEELWPSWYWDMIEDDRQREEWRPRNGIWVPGA